MSNDHRSEMPTIRPKTAPELHRDKAWEEATGWRFMPRAFIGAHCPCWITRRAVCDARCKLGLDEDSPRWPVWDHPRRVVSPTGRRAILLQPFTMTAETAADLSTYCDRHGLMWAINGCSPYSPGSTFSIVVQAAGTFIQQPWLDGDPHTACVFGPGDPHETRSEA